MKHTPDLTSNEGNEGLAPAVLVERADARIAELREEHEEAKRRITNAEASLETQHDELLAAQRRVAAAQEGYRGIERDVAQAKALASLATGTPNEGDLVARLERLGNERDAAERTLTEAMHDAAACEERTRTTHGLITGEIAHGQTQLERVASELDSLSHLRDEAYARLGEARQAAIAEDLRARRERLAALRAEVASAEADLAVAQDAAPRALAEWPARASAMRPAAKLRTTPAMELARRWLSVAEWLDEHGKDLNIYGHLNGAYLNLPGVFTITDYDLRALLASEMRLTPGSEWTRKVAMARQIAAGGLA